MKRKGVRFFHCRGTGDELVEAPPGSIKKYVLVLHHCDGNWLNFHIFYIVPRFICAFILDRIAKKWSFSIIDFFSKCDQIRRKLANLVTFTEEILNGKLHFCAAFMLWRSLLFLVIVWPIEWAEYKTSSSYNKWINFIWFVNFINILA